jgi:hypothetical protein
MFAAPADDPVIPAYFLARAGRFLRDEKSPGPNTFKQAVIKGMVRGSPEFSLPERRATTAVRMYPLSMGIPPSRPNVCRY